MREDDLTGQGLPYDDVDEDGFDQEIYERLHAALDSAGPSEEAQDRMLANLLAAQMAHGAARPEAVEAVELNSHIDKVGMTDQPVAEGLSVLEGGKRKGARRLRTLGLAVAASVVLAVLGVSVASRINGTSYQAADSAQEKVASAGSEADGFEEEASEAVPVALSAEEAPSDSLSDTPDAGGALEPPAELETFEQSGGAFDVHEDPSYDLAVGYPEIRLRTGEVLMIEKHLGEPVIIGDEWVEGFKGDADAFSEDGLDSVRCWVYLLPVSDDGLYVVRYVQDGSCYAVRIVE